MGTASERAEAEWRAAEADGKWTPHPGDALEHCVFERAGFRAYSLAAEDGRWRVVLSRVDPSERTPTGLVTVYAPEHDQAFGDLDGQVLTRSVGLFGGTNLQQLTQTLEKRLGGAADEWTRRCDYLITRTVREVQIAVQGVVFTDFANAATPLSTDFVFRGRQRAKRTMSLFGPGSSGKTTLTDALAVSLASGVTIVPDWEPTCVRRVGILDFDEGPEEEQIRLGAVCRGASVTLATGICYRSMSRPLAEAADEVGRWVTEQGIEVLIVSPVNRALRQGNGDPAAPVFELYELLRELGTTNILIDHVVGAAIGTPDAIREYGSVAKRDAARVSYSVYQQSEEPGRRVVVVRNTKPEALAPRRAAQAVRVEFDPAYPVDGGYKTIRFFEDVVLGEPHGKVGSLAERCREALLEAGHPLTGKELASLLDADEAGVHSALYRKSAKSGKPNFIKLGEIGWWPVDVPVPDYHGGAGSG
jgi:hypothetical protein